MEILQVTLTLITQVITIAAIFLGPWYAFYRARQHDEEKEARERKKDIFKSLMATRAYTYTHSWKHVEALNQIDLEFDKNDPKEKEVLSAWLVYRDQLVNISTETSEHKRWDEKRVELLVDLLHKMANVLGYDSDKTHIKNYPYASIEHINESAEQKIVRQEFLKILQGQSSLRMAITSLPQQNQQGDQNGQGG